MHEDHIELAKNLLVHRGALRIYIIYIPFTTTIFQACSKPPRNAKAWKAQVAGATYLSEHMNQTIDDHFLRKPGQGSGDSPNLLPRRYCRLQSWLHCLVEPEATRGSESSSTQRIIPIMTSKSCRSVHTYVYVYKFQRYTHIHVYYIYIHVLKSKG